MPASQEDIRTAGRVASINDDVTDEERLRALASYGVLDTPAESAFDSIVAIAAAACDAPCALVSFVASERQWFKAKVGFEACETPLSQSVCAHALAEDDVLVIRDLAKDRRTSANTLVTGAPHLRFYAGVVLRTEDGHALGSLCVLDDAPRTGLTDQQTTVMRELGRQVMALLDMRKDLIRSVDDRLDQTRVHRGLDIAATAVRANELKQRLAIDATRMGIFDYDLATGELNWDARVRELFGVPSTGPVTYERSFLAGVHPDERAAADAAIRAALDPMGDGAFDLDCRTVAPDGRVRWVAARGQSVVEDGETVRFVGTVRDVTERRTADDRVAATLERYRLVGRVTKDVIWDWDLTNDHVVWNEALTAAYGHRIEDVAPTPGWWLDHVHEDDRDRVRDDIYRVIEGVDRDWRHEYRFRRSDGSWAEVFDRGSMIRDIDGKPLRMIGAMFDNSVRKAEEERQGLLNRELSHRMKNILTMVQAIASQTLRGVDGAEGAQAVLAGRLQALGKAHDILLGDAADGAVLDRIVEDAIRVHLDIPGRVDMRGPKVEIGSKAALPIILMLHELATNAVKYGALSNGDGRVSIVWTVKGRIGSERLRLRWQESGGPTVSPPGRKGFGSRLIERGLAGQLGAEVKLDYRPEGVTCDVDAPMDRVRETD